ncbi:MAG TPA: DUF4892 domain-containing protein [Pseudomonas xinjiangensis]|uniref:DUF4892 domain-containing protein n=2 Tax=root TaxID=1 RepID=A0A7V1BPS5_9GAMM|nr:DUF4892 domain-containing protein [Halopseudomonas xinjiangensis]HEC49412.1 DUF4892 domain-containing protein [Halopseudomonas xinjiangensis]
MLSRSRLALMVYGVGLSLATASIQAATAVPEELVIEPYPRAQVAKLRTVEDIEHAVVIGGIRRINNQLRAEREVRTTGDLIRVSWQIPEGHDSAEAFKHAKQQLLARDHAMLFFCEGRECGSSSLWANQVLEFSRLYGPEEAQAYLAVRLDDEPQRFVSLYAITRGNREVYLHLDQFTPTEPVTERLYPTPSTLLKVLRKDGSVSVPSVDMAAADTDVTDSWLRILNRALRSDTQVRIVVHGAQAPAFVQGLKDLGVRPQRVEVGEPAPENGILIVRL